MQNRHVQIFVDLCRTYEKYTSKIDTHKILVDLCWTYDKDTYNKLDIVREIHEHFLLQEVIACNQNYMIF